MLPMRAIPGILFSVSHFKYKRYKYSPHVVVMLQFPRVIIHLESGTKDRLQVTVLARSRGTLAERL